jgi:hypothetical protein
MRGWSAKMDEKKWRSCGEEKDRSRVKEERIEK